MKKRKKGIVLRCDGDEEWIGGIYYIRNIAFVLSQNKYVLKNYRIIVILEECHEKYFEYLPSNIVKKVIPRHTSRYSIFRTVSLTWIILKYNVRYWYPRLRLGKEILSKYGITPINWIADFQHLHLPELFTAEDIEYRDRINKFSAMSSIPLVLSSYDAKNDFQRTYRPSNKSIYIVPFVSYIENEIRNLTKKRETKILEKHGIDGLQYICVSNQFWRHKNHIVVLKAMKVLSKRNMMDNIQIVFTGMLKDYRNPEYYKEVIGLMEDKEIAGHVRVLGFIDRVDQIAIMKNARYIIQPSLFEGWGTVLEDAKVLDKLVLLSDIPVHREQMNENCILFDPYDYEELASKIIKANQVNHVDDVKKGINGMYERSRKYSLEFERLLKEI